MKGIYQRQPRKLKREVLEEMAGTMLTDVRAELGVSKSALLAAVKREGLRHLFPSRSESAVIYRYGYFGKN